MRHWPVWLALAAILALLGCANTKQWREEDDKTMGGVDPAYGAGKVPDGR